MKIVNFEYHVYNNPAVVKSSLFDISLMEFCKFNTCDAYIIWQNFGVDRFSIVLIEISVNRDGLMSKIVQLKFQKGFTVILFLVYFIKDNNRYNSVMETTTKQLNC